jgi:hypothetical protein
MIISHSNAPGIYLQLTQDEVNSLPAKVLDTMNGLAILMNGTIVSLCVLAVVTIWKNSFKKIDWQFWTLFIALWFVQIIGFVSDSYFNNINILANSISSFILILGFTCLYLAAKNLHKKRLE